MAKSKLFTGVNGTKYLVFYCEACGHDHVVPYEYHESFNWNFNGDFDKPTLTPSVNNTTGSFASPGYDGGIPPTRCHFFVTDGRIHYCADCTHTFAGRLVDLRDVAPDIE